MVELFNELIYQPLYNLLIFLVNVLPNHSVALAVVVLTLVVKFALFPLALKMAKTQKKIKQIAPEIEKIKENHKEDKQAQALALMELYRKHEIKPLGSFLSLLIQIPIVIGLYLVFLKSGLPKVNEELLYSFVFAPEYANMHLFNISMSDKSVALATFVALTQFAFAKMMQKDIQFTDETDTLKADLQKSLSIQMQYVFPALMAVVAYSFGAGIALYFLVSNAFQIAQELYFKYKKIK